MREQYEDTDFDASLKKANSDLLWNNKQKQTLKKNILSDIEKLEFQEQKNKNPILLPTIKRGGLIRKLTYSGIALVILFSLLIGSAFISPAMAEVIAKIPYLNQVFHTEPVQQTIMEKLQNEDFKIDGIDTTGKKIEIRVNGSEQYFQDVRKDVEEIALEILKSRNYNAYTVKAIRSNHTYEKPSPETLKQVEKAIKVDEALQQELAKYNYQDVTTQVGTMNNAGDLSIHIGIPNTEKNPEKIKELARNVIEEKTNQKYTVEFEKINLKVREQENRWLRILIPMFDGLNSKKEYYFKNYSFSALPQPMTLYIETTMSSSNPNSKQLGKKIENTIVEFLESEEAKQIIKDDEYQITVYSKDKKKIN